MYTTQELHIECIELDLVFINENIKKAKHFFQIAILPELLDRWFSRPPEQISSTVLSPKKTLNPPSSALQPLSDISNLPTFQSDVPGEVFRYCQKGEHGKMVGCDNNDCVYQWFHLECLKLKALPRSSKWYCPDCRKKKK